MIISFIKNLVFFFCCFKTEAFLTKQNQIIQRKFEYLLVLLFSVETILLKQYIPEVSYFVPALSFSLVILLLSTMSVSYCFCSTLLSYGINLFIYEVLLLLVATVFSPLHLPQHQSWVSVIMICVSFLQPCLLYLFFHSHRFQNSFIFLRKQQVINIGSILSLFAICILTHEQMTDFSLSYVRLMRMFMLLLFAFILVLWWRAQITKSYRERLRVLEVESLRTSQTEQQTYIKQLEEQNERMGKIIHKDNRLVNAMADSISQYLVSSAVLPTSELQSLGASLSSQISEIHEDRQVLLNTKSATPSPLPQTGHAGIDAMITYMSKEAAENKIEFHFHYGKDFFENNVTELRENDLAHLLSDTLENAIIATRFGGGGVIELSMLKIKGIPTISISDSGIPFELDTYMNLGLQKASTHLDTGGSGIGLMDLWALKEKYMATLYIDEHPEAPNMTKRIVYIFDRKNRYMISTNRFKELQQKQTRADLFVINPNTEAVI
ncbi:MAG: hypothetical protein MR010_08660 [Lachnospiraceae bacterium]|nr:hypothetical protein [Lachnospiraceae bacterium]